jgi:predicted dehydrogenase
MMLRFKGGARGMLWASQVASGNENHLAIRIYGEKGDWSGSRKIRTNSGIARSVNRADC